MRLRGAAPAAAAEIRHRQSAKTQPGHDAVTLRAQLACKPHQRDTAKSTLSPTFAGASSCCAVRRGEGLFPVPSPPPVSSCELPTTRSKRRNTF